MLIYLKKNKMKKHLITILILSICTIFVFINTRKPKEYRVIDIYESNLICVDFNKNSVCDTGEKIKIFGFTSFPEKFGSQSKFIKDRYNIEEKDIVVLGIISKNFTENSLLNKLITVQILDKSNNNFDTAKIFINNEDFTAKILKEGYAITQNNEYKIYENIAAIDKNIKLSKKFNYQLRNKKNGKIHTLDCEYGRMAEDYEIGIFDEEKYKKDYCNYCHNKKIPRNIIKNFNNYLTDTIKIYFLDSSKQLKPDTNCSHAACKILLDNINNATKNIDFAIFGLGNVPKIEQAIINADKRGVKIRCITDENSKHENLYERTKNLTSNLQSCKTDYINGETSAFNNYLMHNKFFIFDDRSVWLGSANISETDLSGFSTNNVLLIKSDELAKIYKNEFEKMYNGNFHTHKTMTQNNSLNLNGTNFKVLFSPQDKIITNQIIPLIRNAKKSILIETFIITYKPFADELIKIKKSGVDIRIIVDATSASTQYSMVKYLRDNKIKVKVENYAGKMHMKTIIIDDDYFITGSMNLTKSGEKYNDENMLIIKNNKINTAARIFFDYLWSKIPDKYLYRNISAESKESIGSCTDRIDNDYNGKTDAEDEKCK